MAEMTLDISRQRALARARARQAAAMAAQQQTASVATPVSAPPPPPAPEQPSAMTQFGRSAASLADVAIGAVPGIAQAVAYPFMRAGGMSPQEAEQTAAGILPSLQQPVGRAFGVTETPEYQQEASRRLMGFIGENIGKGTAWLSEQTGLPESDVANMAGTLSMAAPQAAGALRRAAAPTLQDINIATGGAARAAKRSAESYARAPRLDAAAEAQRLGIALHPVEIAPTRRAKLGSTIAGPKAATEIVDANRLRVTEIAKNELGIPMEQSLASKNAFDLARQQLSGPYDEIRAIPTITADAKMLGALDDLRPSETLIGVSGKPLNKLIDDAQMKLDEGMSGAELLDNISNLRKKAKRTYSMSSPDAKQLELADTQMALADRLESVIDANVTDPGLLSRYRDARQKMARTYAYEDATDFTTGMVDVNKLARIVAKDNALSGDIASLGRIAGNFPSAFKTTPATWGDYLLSIGSRSGLSGATGAMLGSQFGLTGSIAGGVLGAGAGQIAGGLYARRMASPGFQQGLRIPDYRIPPVNALTPEAAAPAAAQNQLALGYDPRLNEVAQVTRVRNPNDPNWVYGRPDAQVTPIRPDLTNALPAPSAEATINALRTEQARAGQMSRTLGAAEEARMAAAEAAAPRAVTKGGVVLGGPDYTAPSRIIKVETPALQSAVEKLSGQVVGETTGTRFSTNKIVTPKGGQQPYQRKIKPLVKGAETTYSRQPQAFAMSAEERIAWNKAKANLAEVMPGMKALTDKAIANKIMDRQWAQQAVTKAREQAAAFEQIAQRAKDQQTKMQAMARREEMMSLAEDMEAQLSMPRATSKGKGQGPKTLAAKRNQLRGDVETLNNLLE